MPITVAVQKPVVQLPASAVSPSPIFLPYASAIKDADIVYFATGTQASGFYLLGGNFVAGDTITYNIHGTGPIVLTVTNSTSAIQQLVNSINANSLTNLVSAVISGPSKDIVLMTANTPGTAGNAITTTISTTSVTGEVAASGATLVGGSALGPSGAVSSAPADVAGGIVGVAQCPSSQTFAGHSPATGMQYPADVLGQGQVGTGLFSAQPGQVPILTLGPPIVTVINLTATTGWISGGTQQATYGTPVGINIDPVTGFYIADPTLGNLVAVIQDVDNSVNNAITSTLGGAIYQANPIGLLGARVKIAFLATALAVVQGG